MRVRTAAPAILLASLAAAGTLAAHDLFLKLDSYLLPPRSKVLVPVLNGTFTTSANAITRDRLADLSVAGTRGTEHLDAATAWRERKTSSVFAFTTGPAGTYVIGASTKPSEITLAGKDFNAYLADDGIDDVLEARRAAGELETGATERYAKHVKAVIQVGARRDSGYAAVLGYPAEIVPENNPYRLRRGDTLVVRCLVDGQPVANQIVLAGGRTAAGSRIAAQKTRTDANGLARIRVTRSGRWYVKFIHMTPVSGDPKLTHESKWATLTFEMR